jgi:hypothetical protein
MFLILLCERSKKLPNEPTVQVSDTTGMPKELKLVTKI